MDPYLWPWSLSHPDCDPEVRLEPGGPTAFLLSSYNEPSSEPCYQCSVNPCQPRIVGYPSFRSETTLILFSLVWRYQLPIQVLSGLALLSFWHQKRSDRFRVVCSEMAVSSQCHTSLHLGGKSWLSWREMPSIKCLINISHHEWGDSLLSRFIL